VTPADPKGIDVEPAGDDELMVAPTFGPRRSRRPALQEAKGGVPPIRTRKQPPNKAGLSLLLTHPIILRDLPPHADARPSQSELTRLHRTLTQRDLVMLQSLYDYRYLNTLQVKELFFPSLRSCQMRLQYLKELGLVYSWKVIETPGVKRRHSLLLISARGARVLADWHGDDQRSYVERSHAVRDHCWHATHDLEANQLFVALVMQSRLRRAEGLLHWYSEEHVRAERGEMAREYEWPLPAPDGSGVYLQREGRILFDLEWDRATESLARLRKKLNAYVGYYKHFSNARQHHVLFVVPSDDREDNIHFTIWQRRPHYTSDNCCSFWTTTAYRLRWWGPLGAIWGSVDVRAEKAPPYGITSVQERIRLNQMEPMNTNEGVISDCVGKPSWWERRPGGAQEG
jgi:hypothetical protein